MPLPFVLWGAAAALAATGVFKGVEAKNNFEKAKEIGRDAERKYEKSAEKLNLSRENTQAQLKDLGALKVSAFTNQIKHLVNVIKKGKSKISGFNEEITEEQLNEYEKMVLNSLSIEKGIGTGAASGALAAMGAYGAVGTLATASTGAAISGLSGVAATNATLAWLGGGALSAGGFGMAGGMIALGGIVLGPALAVGGFMMAGKAEEALSKAYEYEAEVATAIEEMKTAEAMLKAIRTNISEMTFVINQLMEKFDLVKVENINDEVAFSRMLTLGKGLKSALDISIIDKDGEAAKGIKSKCSGFLEISSSED